MRSRFIIPAIIISALLGIGLVMLLRPSMMDLSQNMGSKVSFEDLSRYPGAHIISSTSKENNLVHELRFETTHERTTVVNYYERLLSSDQWQTIDKDHAEGTYEFLAMQSEYGEGRARYLSIISVLAGDQSLALPDLPTIVNVTLLDIPNPRYLDIYPGAEEIQAQEKTKEDGTATLVTSYSLKSSAEDVISFYANVMPQNGWKVPEGGGKHNSGEFAFEFAVVGPYNVLYWGRTAISVSSTQEGRTYVEIAASGYNIDSAVK